MHYYYMRNIWLLTVWCIFSLGAWAPCGRYEYVLKIQTPSGLTLQERWVGYYRGTCIPFRGNLALLHESHMRFTFSLIITPSLRYEFSDVIHNQPILTLREHVPVAWFDLSLVMKDGKWTWDYVQLKPAEMPLRLPDHALVLLFDPSLMALADPVRVKYPKDTTYEGGCALIELPTLVVRGSPEEIAKAARAAYCASLDVRAIHDIVSCEDRLIEGCCCTIPL